MKRNDPNRHTKSGEKIQGVKGTLHPRSARPYETFCHIIGVPEWEERKYRAKEILEWIVDERFPEITKDTITQIHKAQKTPSKIITNKNTPACNIYKLLKNKKKILRAAKGKGHVTQRKKIIRKMTDSWSGAVRARNNGIIWLKLKV